MQNDLLTIASDHNCRIALTEWIHAYIHAIIELMLYMFPYINDQIKMTIQQQHCKLHSENCTQKQKYKILLSDAPQSYMYNVKWHRQALLILPAKSFQFDQWWLPVESDDDTRQACSYSLRYRVETTNIRWTICTDIYISTTNADITQYTSCTNISAVYPVYTIYVPYML